MDEECPLKGLEDESTPDHCRMLRKAFKKYTELPACWDFNETVVSGQPCRNETGHVNPSCIEVAITSSAQIVVCGGKLANDDQCGTFLEIHQKGMYCIPLPYPRNVLRRVETFLHHRRIHTIGSQRNCAFFEAYHHAIFIRSVYLCQLALTRKRGGNILPPFIFQTKALVLLNVCAISRPSFIS